MLGNSQMGKVRTLKSITNSIGQGLFGQNRIGFNDPSFRMSPLGLNGIEPRTYHWQKASRNANPLTLAFDRAIVGTNPLANGLTDMPTGIVPDHRQDRQSQFFKFLATPRQKLRGDGTHRTPFHEAQQHPSHGPPETHPPSAAACHRMREKVFQQESLTHRA